MGTIWLPMESLAWLLKTAFLERSPDGRDYRVRNAWDCVRRSGPCVPAPLPLCFPLLAVEATLLKGKQPGAAGPFESIGLFAPCLPSPPVTIASQYALQLLATVASERLNARCGESSRAEMKSFHILLPVWFLRRPPPTTRQLGRGPPGAPESPLKVPPCAVAGKIRSQRPALRDSAIGRFNWARRPRGRGSGAVRKGAILATAARKRKDLQEALLKIGGARVFVSVRGAYVRTLASRVLVTAPEGVHDIPGARYEPRTGKERQSAKAPTAAVAEQANKILLQSSGVANRRLLTPPRSPHPTHRSTVTRKGQSSRQADRQAGSRRKLHASRWTAVFNCRQRSLVLSSSAPVLRFAVSNTDSR
ncbi:hypothetical protein SKAU_G00198140 [Synaphobranchus kaupii]|uniref:Uncharacterized protein n=1 Tax=Synaphobranchus kaupii TaxID=118154 RepID=A0A9Q1FFA4_SYNKA|nr:hypothetical protein SKAU_G00198140 [Synaphobranchus kaupii]